VEIALIALLIAVLVRYGAFGDRAGGIIRRAVRPALIVGGIGFAAGFFGPMIFKPEANQGPMLGIFITGPLGFVIGLIYGVIQECMRPEARSSAGG
jgi:preprotein translocase subunit Sss1